MSEMLTVLIAGASRGIGLALARQYAEAGHNVIAGCRRPEEAVALQKLTVLFKVTVYPLDTSSDDSVASFRAAVGDLPISILLVVAGTAGGFPQDFGTIDFADMAVTLNVNTAGPLRLAQAFESNVSAAEDAKLVAITSDMGSIERTEATDMMVYRISKAALNEAWKCVSIDLRHKGVTAMVIHPGWVSTEMGGVQAPVTPDQSATGIRAVVADLTIADAGTFRTFDGETRPW